MFLLCSFSVPFRLLFLFIPFLQYIAIFYCNIVCSIVALLIGLHHLHPIVFSLWILAIAFSYLLRDLLWLAGLFLPILSRPHKYSWLHPGCTQPPQSAALYKCLLSFLFWEKWICLFGNSYICSRDATVFVEAGGMVDNCNANSYKVGRNPSSCCCRSGPIVSNSIFLQNVTFSNQRPKKI